ncbi:hypothetical protein BHECKSOX_2284, partial [Bathymodiolus heckerae thiotrophic gill symbiont]|uniref:hypothetical protein n=1 Tax=Bathymodiolus heckerae thiotrophic gill symbiont TaxID=1052212 RepID=UPI0010B40985
GEDDFNEQERRTLENATVGWWKSNGVSMNEVVTDSSSQSTSENAGFDSKKSLWGKVVEKTTGIEGGVSVRADQSTGSDERMEFNSLNDVASNLIDKAGGDSAKLAGWIDQFDNHVRDLRAEATGINTLTNNISSDADKMFKSDEQLQDNKQALKEDEQRMKDYLASKGGG